MEKGSYEGLSIKLSPWVMDGTSLYQSLETMCQTGLEKGYHPLTTVLPHIFKLPFSINVHEVRNFMDIITHVPIAIVHTDRILYETISVVFLIKKKSNNGIKNKKITEYRTQS